MMMIGRVTILSIAIILFSPLACVAADRVTTPRPNSHEGKAILDTIYPAIEWQSAGPVEFYQLYLKVQDGWAVVRGRIRRPGGASVELRKVRLISNCATNRVDALVQLIGKLWYLVDWELCVSDAADDQETTSFYLWSKTKLPKGLFVK